MVSARAVTNEYGGMRQSTITAETIAMGEDYDPWLIKTQPFRRMGLSAVRDNVSGLHRLDQFGTLVMYAISTGFKDTETCTLADNRKSVCQDLYVGNYVFRKVKGLMYKRKLKKGESIDADYRSS